MPPVKIGAFESGVARKMQTQDIIHASDGSVTCTDRYIVTFAPGEQPRTLDATQVPGIPISGTPHQDLPGIFSQALHTTPHNENAGNLTWYIDVEYGRRPVAESTISNFVATTLARSWGYETMELPLTNDAITGKAILNSAGDTFLSLPNASIPVKKIVLVRRESRKPSTIYQYNMTINSVQGSFLGVTVPPRCGLLKITVQDNLDQTARRYTYTYEMLVRSQLVFLNPVQYDANIKTEIGGDDAAIERGLYYLVNDPDNPGQKKRRRFMEETHTIDRDGDEVPAQDDEGNIILAPSAQACLLDDKGGDLRNFKNADGTNMVYLRRTSLFREENWTALQLPGDD